MRVRGRPSMEISAPVSPVSPQVSVQRSIRAAAVRSGSARSLSRQRGGKRGAIGRRRTSPRVGVRKDWLLPEHLEASGGHLRHLQVGGPHFMGGESCGQGERCCQDQRQAAPGAVAGPRFGDRPCQRGHVPTVAPRETPRRASGRRSVHAAPGARPGSARGAVPPAVPGRPDPARRPAPGSEARSCSAPGPGAYRARSRAARASPPAGRPSSAAAKSAPNSSAISRSVRSVYSLSSGNGSPARLQPSALPSRTTSSSAAASRCGSARPPALR